MAVDAVVYYKIYDATMSITKVENASRATRFLAQTTLRNVLGTRSLSEILSEREAISHNIQVSQCFAQFSFSILSFILFFISHSKKTRAEVNNS